MNEFKVQFFAAGSSSPFDRSQMVALIEFWLNGLHEGGWAVKIVHVDIGPSSAFVIASRWKRSTFDQTDPKRLAGALSPQDEPVITYDNDR